MQTSSIIEQTIDKKTSKAGVPLTDYKSWRVRSRWFDRMKFAPIIFNHCFDPTARLSDQISH